MDRYLPRDARQIFSPESTSDLVCVTIVHAHAWRSEADDGKAAKQTQIFSVEPLVQRSLQLLKPIR